MKTIGTSIRYGSMGACNRQKDGTIHWFDFSYGSRFSIFTETLLVKKAQYGDKFLQKAICGEPIFTTTNNVSIIINVSIKTKVKLNKK